MVGGITEFSQPAFSQVLANSNFLSANKKVCNVADAQLLEQACFRIYIHELIRILLVGSSRGRSSNTLEAITGRFVAMAS